VMLGPPYDGDQMPPRQQSEGIRYLSMKMLLMFATPCL